MPDSAPHRSRPFPKFFHKRIGKIIQGRIAHLVSNFRDGKRGRLEHKPFGVQVDGRGEPDFQYALQYQFG